MKWSDGWAWWAAWRVWRRPEERGVDLGDMGTAFGLDASLAPNASERPSVPEREDAMSRRSVRSRH